MIFWLRYCSQNDRPPSAGDRGKIAGQMVHGAVREQGESHRFFRVDWQTELIRQGHRKLRQQFSEPVDEKSIVRATAGDNQAVDSRLGKSKLG